MIVGVDVSSRRVDLAWLEDGKPQRWHQELAKGHLIDRLRSINVKWPTNSDGPRVLSMSGDQITVTGPLYDVTDIAIEYPFGRGNAIAALMATVGVITRQAPAWTRVAWPSAGELRAAIGARNKKDDAHKKIKQLYPPGCTILHGTQVIPRGTFEWDEHELDALVACIGWTRILAAQEHSCLP